MKKINKGSAIIEITLLIPVFLWCVYFFIMFYMFLIDSGRKMEILCEKIYEIAADEKDIDLKPASDYNIKKEGTTIKISYEEQGKWFDYDILLQRDINNPAKNIRRWQLAAEQF